MTTWVLLRGLAREARHWGSFVELLRHAVPAGDAVVALDLPGNGTLWRQRSPARVVGMVDAARRELDLRAVRPPLVLLAISLGGMVALEWAARDPDSVIACVLINSSSARFSPLWQRLRPRSYPMLLAALRPGATALERETRILALTCNRPLSSATAASWVQYARHHPLARANMLRQLWAAARFHASRPEVPTLLLASRQDRLVAPDCSRAMARAWQLPLREHPWAGHDLPLDDPEWVVRQVTGWLGTVRSRP